MKDSCVSRLLTAKLWASSLWSCIANKAVRLKVLQNINAPKRWTEERRDVWHLSSKQDHHQWIKATKTLPKVYHHIWFGPSFGLWEMALSRELQLSQNQFCIQTHRKKLTNYLQRDIMIYKWRIIIMELVK
jgi:uncharacterized protein YjiS (DUF1127 family)